MPFSLLFSVHAKKLSGSEKTAKEFKQDILDFFEIIWPQIAPTMVDRINDNFSPLK
jgi:hypothetical protein